MSGHPQPMVERLAFAMMDSDEAEHGISGEPDWYERLAGVAMKVQREAGVVQWRVFRKTDASDAAIPFDPREYPTQERAERAIRTDYLPDMLDWLEARPRLIVPMDRPGAVQETPAAP